MMMDVLSHWNNYPWASERFKKGFRFLETLSADTPDGRTDIDGEAVFCMVQSYDARPWEGEQFEAHRQYADIQMLLAGEESILWAPVEGLRETQPYEPDVTFYALTSAPTELVLIPGVFCVFLPSDAHAPCLQHGAPSHVRKAVVKVRVA